MGGRITEGLGREAAPDSQSYEPGMLAYDQRLVEDLIALHFSANALIALPSRGETIEGCTFYEFTKSVLPQRLRSFEGLDCQAFLDAVVMGVWETAGFDTPEDSFHPDYLVREVVEALHEAGFPSLDVDLSFLPKEAHRVCGGLWPAKGGMKTIRCLLPRDGARDIGNFAEGYRFLIAGKSGEVGTSGVGSDYTIEGAVGYVGLSAKASTFRLAAIRPDARLAWGTEKGILICMNDPNLVLSNGGYKVRLDADFFDRKNTLLVPDSAGSWKEVRP